MAGEALPLAALAQALLYSLAHEICFHTDMTIAYLLSLLQIPGRTGLSLQKDITPGFQPNWTKISVLDPPSLRHPSPVSQ